MKPVRKFNPPESRWMVRIDGKISRISLRSCNAELSKPCRFPRYGFKWINKIKLGWYRGHYARPFGNQPFFISSDARRVAPFCKSNKVKMSSKRSATVVLMRQTACSVAEFNPNGMTSKAQSESCRRSTVVLMKQALGRS